MAKYNKLEQEYESFKKLVKIEIDLLTVIANAKDGELDDAI